MIVKHRVRIARRSAGSGVRGLASQGREFTEWVVLRGVAIEDRELTRLVVSWGDIARDQGRRDLVRIDVSCNAVVADCGQVPRAIVVVCQ